MSINQLLYTGRDALAAQTYGLSVTSQNITNANTPGYTRRVAVLASQVMGSETYGSVKAEGLLRATNAYLQQKTYSTSGSTSGSSARDSQLEQIEAVFNDLAGAGIGDSIDHINKSFQQLSVDPSDLVARQDVLAALSDFASQMNQTGEALSSQKTEIVNQMQSLVAKVNESSKSLATLNQQIVHAVAQGLDAADLKDKRDQILTDLSSVVNVRVIESADGSMLVQAAGGALVDGAEFRVMSMDLGTDGNVHLYTQRDGASTKMEVTSGLSGGELAGLKQARDEDLAAVMSKLDQFAYDFASALNTQHASGFGLDGSTGNLLFDLSAVTSPPDSASRVMKVAAGVLADNKKLAASDTATGVPGSGVNAKQIAKVFDQDIIGGSRTASEGYADIIGDVGIMKSNSAEESSIRQAMKEQFTQLKESTTGVSLDEEMVNLTTYQRAYQAASKVLQVADQLLQELISLKS